MATTVAPPQVILHAHAKLTPAGRRLLVGRIASGRPIAHVAAETGVARQTATRWRGGGSAKARPDLKTCTLLEEWA